jgi:choice-of-anchor C domain-containing protein
MRIHIERKSLLGLGLGAVLWSACGPEVPEDTAPETGQASQRLTNVIVNGSFETAPSLGFSNYITLSSSTTGLTGWTVQNSVQLLSNTYKTPAQGTRSINLSYGGVSQTFPTVAGAGYTVNFSLSTSPACATSMRTMDVSVNGITYNFSTSSTSWTHRNFVFNAAGTSATLVFKNSYTNQSCGPAVDNISVMGP